MPAPTIPRGGAPSERRRYPRSPSDLEVVLVTADGEEVPARAVDISYGGMRVHCAELLPVGRTWVVFDTGRAIEAEVRGQLIDLSVGAVVVRLLFVGPAAEDRRQRTLIRAAFAVIALVAVLVVVALALSDDPAPERDAVRATATTVPTEPTVTTVTGTGDPTPATSVASTTVPAAPAPTPTTAATAPAPPTTAAPPASPPRATSTERADSTLTVTISEDGSAASGTSTVGPSQGVDPVRVHVQFGPEPDADGRYPVAITVESREQEPITVGDDRGGALIRITDGASGAVQDVPVGGRGQIELAPGEIATLDGAVALQPGTYTLDALVDITRRVD